MLLKLYTRLYSTPMAVRTGQYVSIRHSLVGIGIVEEVDYERRNAHRAIEAVTGASIAIALNHGTWYFEQAVGAVPIQRLLYHAPWTPYLQAIFTVKKVLEWIQSVVGATVLGIQSFFVVVKGGEDMRGAFGRSRRVAVEAVAGVVRVGKGLCHGEATSSDRQPEHGHCFSSCLAGNLWVSRCGSRGGELLDMAGRSRWSQTPIGAAAPGS